MTLYRSYAWTSNDLNYCIYMYVPPSLSPPPSSRLQIRYLGCLKRSSRHWRRSRNVWNRCMGMESSLLVTSSQNAVTWSISLITMNLAYQWVCCSYKHNTGIYIYIYIYGTCMYLIYTHSHAHIYMYACTHTHTRTRTRTHTHTHTHTHAHAHTHTPLQISVQQTCDRISGIASTLAESVYGFLDSTFEENQIIPLKWQYFGSEKGILNQYPSSRPSDCSSYDNRFRWVWIVNFHGCRSTHMLLE